MTSFKLVGPEEGKESKDVKLELFQWELIVERLMVQYETSRDEVNNYMGPEEHREEEIEFHTHLINKTKESIRSIQTQVGHEWLEFVDTTLWSRMIEVEVDNRDDTTTELIVGGRLAIEVTKSELEGYLESGLKDEETVSLMMSLTTVVLTGKDVKYLLDNMKENSESE